MPEHKRKHTFLRLAFSGLLLSSRKKEFICIFLLNGCKFSVASDDYNQHKIYCCNLKTRQEVVLWCALYPSNFVATVFSFHQVATARKTAVPASELRHGDVKWALQKNKSITPSSERLFSTTIWGYFAGTERTRKMAFDTMLQFSSSQKFAKTFQLHNNIR